MRLSLPLAWSIVPFSVPLSSLVFVQVVLFFRFCLFLDQILVPNCLVLFGFGGANVICILVQMVMFCKLSWVFFVSGMHAAPELSWFLAKVFGFLSSSWFSIAPSV